MNIHFNGVSGPRRVISIPERYLGTDDLNILFPKTCEVLDHLDEITGYGIPGAKISVSIDDIEIACSTVCANGTWCVQNTHMLEPGDHLIIVTQDDCGNFSSAFRRFSLCYFCFPCCVCVPCDENG